MRTGGLGFKWIRWDLSKCLRYDSCLSVTETSFACYRKKTCGKLSTKVEFSSYERNYRGEMSYIARFKVASLGWPRLYQLQHGPIRNLNRSNSHVISSLFVLLYMINFRNYLYIGSSTNFATNQRRSRHFKE